MSDLSNAAADQGARLLLALGFFLLCVGFTVGVLLVKACG